MLKKRVKDEFAKAITLPFQHTAFFEMYNSRIVPCKKKGFVATKNLWKNLISQARKN